MYVSKVVFIFMFTELFLSKNIGPVGYLKKMKKFCYLQWYFACILFMLYPFILIY